MLQLLAILGLDLVLWLACAGVGVAVLSSGRRGYTTVSWHHVGVSACVGLAVLLALGGFSVLLELPIMVGATVFVVVGLVLLARQIRTRCARRVPRAVLIWSAIGALAVGFVVLTAAAEGLLSTFNPCDDDLAYLPMAHRLLDTGGLIEAWSLRRLQNLGGATYLQAFAVGLFGDGALHLPETLVSTTFIAGVFLPMGRRSTWARAAGLAVLLAPLIAAVPRISSSAVLLAVPMVLAGFVAAAELRAAMADRDRAATSRWMIAAGLLIAGSASIRLNSVPGLGVAIVLGILTIADVPRATRLRTTAGVLVAAAASVAGWSLALWRSSGTPAYPLFPGNANPAVATSRDPNLDGPGEVLGRVIELTTTGPYLWVTLAVLALAVVARRRLPDPGMVAIAAIAVIANIVMLALALTISVDFVQARYTFPAVAALTLFAAYETIRGVDGIGTARDTTPDHPPPPPPEPAGSRWRPLMPSAITLVLLAGLLSLADPGDDSRPLRRAADRITSLQTVLELAQESEVSVGTYAPPEVVTDFRAAVASLPTGAQAIAAVGRPYLIDYDRRDIPNLDLPGWVAPGRDFPFFEGAGAQVEFLRRAGYDHLLAATPGHHLCLQFATRVDDPALLRPARVYAPFYSDWEETLRTIEERAPGAVQSGDAVSLEPIMVIDLDRAALLLDQG